MCQVINALLTRTSFDVDFITLIIFLNPQHKMKQEMTSEMFSAYKISENHFILR